MAAVSSLVEHIYDALNKKLVTISVFIDLKKAFDTLNHSILLEKLSLYGVRGLPLKLLSSYLTDRYQCVRFNSTASTFKKIGIGVPQGSILGPILFLLYINDLPNVSKNLSCLLFADDTTVYKSSNNLNQLTDEFNHELCKIKQWCNTNRLSLNISKTYSMMFNYVNIDHSLVISLENDTISVCRYGSFLGLVIDDKLNFSQHIKQVCTKLSKTVGIFYRLRYYVPSNVLKKMYYSLAYPYFIYGSMLWGGSVASHLRPLELLQKKLIRIITGSEYLAHTNPLFASTKILKITDIHKFIILQHMYKSSNFLLHRSDIHSYSTRSSNDIQPEFQRLSCCQKSIYFAGPILWNSLNSEIRNLQSFNHFKSALKQHFVSQYSDM